LPPQVSVFVHGKFETLTRQSFGNVVGQLSVKVSSSVERYEPEDGAVGHRCNDGSELHDSE
jgi:hypothetical protein